MRTIFVMLAAVLLVRTATAQTPPGTLENTLQAAPCQVPLTFKLQNASLGKVFGELAARAPDCPIRFEVAADLASTEATVDIKAETIGAAMTQLAAAHELQYEQDGAMVMVRRRPRAEDKDKISLGVALVRWRGKPVARPTRPTAVVNVGQCANFRSLLAPAAFRLHAVTATVAKDPDDYAVGVRLCVEKKTAEGLDLLGEVVSREVLDEGFRSREERTVFRRSVGDREKEPSLFRSADGELELALFEHAAGARGSAGNSSSGR
jgi:hypothetical protein